MHEADDELEEYGPSWRRLAIASFTVVLAVLGYYLGDTIASFRTDIKELRAAIAASVTMAPRLDAIQREHVDQEQRLRELERQFWSRPSGRQ